jgi:DNA-binding transcriptional regulator YiaG
LALGLTQVQLAFLLKVTQQAVSAWELDTRSIPGLAEVALQSVENYLKNGDRPPGPKRRK